ncbi:MAG: translational GTPase TypA [Polyangiales bacterium]
MNIRNVAIIAHVDHGKTTLVDAMLAQSGVFRPGEAVRDRVLDSNDLERERGITIQAKNASLRWQDYLFNIIDTPGHADFGGEVERTLRMADGALLLVDAAEGPLPQTRFVLGKAIALGMPVLLVINKIDRGDARPDEVLNEAFDLFCDLGASDAQADFLTLYAIGKDGIARRSLEDTNGDLTPLFEGIIERVPPPKGDKAAPLQFLVHHTEHDDYLGRLAVGRVVQGVLQQGKLVRLIKAESSKDAKVSALLAFEGLARTRIEAVEAGGIAAVAGIEGVEIGDTLASPADAKALPRIEVDEPTLKIRVLINTSPLAGKAGKFVTSRQVRDRLMREAERNIAIRFEDDGEHADRFLIRARGELMVAVLAETLRREGYEISLAMPEVITREHEGKLQEPWERVVVDIPEAHIGGVSALFGERKGQMVRMQPLHGGRQRLEFRLPARGLLGLRTLFLTETRGAGLLNGQFDTWQPAGPPLARRKNGALVADRKGVATPYALFQLQARGELFIAPGTEVYEGMIIGEHNRPNDLDVNVTREKKLTNIRAAGRDDNVLLSPPRQLTIESALDFIDADELLEITPDALRLRKSVLEANRRPKRAMAG